MVLSKRPNTTENNNPLTLGISISIIRSPSNIINEYEIGYLTLNTSKSKENNVSQKMEKSFSTFSDLIVIDEAIAKHIPNN